MTVPRSFGVPRLRFAAERGSSPPTDAGLCVGGCMPKGQPKGQNYTLRERFDAKWTPEPNTGCWLWSAALQGDGYGVFHDALRVKKAHRAGWELYKGPIPDGMVLDHVCRVRSCVNPDHLRVVTLEQNLTENSISPTAVNAMKTKCPECECPFTTSTAPSSAGRRRCLPCRNRKRKVHQ